MIEKGLEFEARYVDILKGEQFDAEYLKLNPFAVVPTLIHNDHVVIESTVILEYLDMVFPQRRLSPSNAKDYVRTRYWTKAVDEKLHSACGALTFSAAHRYIIKKNMNAKELDAYLQKAPQTGIATDWAERKRQLVAMGFEAPGVRDMVLTYDDCIRRMNVELQKSTWLASDEFGLADISLSPYINRLAMMGMSSWWENGRYPHLEDWWNRIQEKPTFESSILDWCPSQLAKDLMEYGTRSWPIVHRILQQRESDCDASGADS